MGDLLQSYGRDVYLPRNDLGPAWEKATFRQYAADYAPFLPRDPAAAVLDVGCGPGAFLQFMRSRGYTSVSGIDASEDQVRIARERGVEGVAHADARTHLAASPARYDLVALNDMIEHVPKADAPRLLEDLRAALKPGGRILLRTPNMACPLATASRYIDFTHEIGLTEWSLEALLRSAGFEEVIVRGSALPGWSPARAARRLVAWLWRGGWWLAYRVHGFAAPRVMTANLVASARRPAGRT